MRRDLGRLVGTEEDLHTDHIGVYTQAGLNAITEGPRLRHTGGRKWKLSPHTIRMKSTKNARGPG